MVRAGIAVLSGSMLANAITSVWPKSMQQSARSLAACVRPVVDDKLQAAVRLVLAALGGRVVRQRCQYSGCKANDGIRYQNGVWCQTHAQKMERV